MYLTTFFSGIVSKVKFKQWPERTESSNSLIDIIQKRIDTLSRPVGCKIYSIMTLHQGSVK